MADAPGVAPPGNKPSQAPDASDCPGRARLDCAHRCFGLDGVLADQPPDKEIQVILDNYSTHKKNDDWPAEYEGRVRFHFTPNSASWLNQIEIVFSLLTRKTRRSASFKNKDQLRTAIEGRMPNLPRR